MGSAVAAELNGYPGPGHVLEFAESLELSRSRQLSGISRVFVQTAPLPISLSGSGPYLSGRPSRAIHPAFPLDGVEQFIGRPFNVRLPSRFRGVHQ